MDLDRAHPRTQETGLRPGDPRRFLSRCAEPRGSRPTVAVTWMEKSGRSDGGVVRPSPNAETFDAPKLPTEEQLRTLDSMANDQ